MKKRAGLIAVVVVIVGGWMLHFHSSLFGRVLPQRLLNWIAEAPAAGDEDSSDAETPEVPVHVAKITRITFHRYIEGYGTIAPSPPRSGRPAGSAAIASPAAGIVAQVLCWSGQIVHKGDVLIQLDDRQAAAALAEEQASLADLLATPRPEQLEIARLAVEKSRATLEYAQKEYDRQNELAAQQGTTGRSLEQAALDLASAKTDLATSENQLALLPPTPQEVAQERAKVAAAQAQLDMLKIISPIDATVTQVSTNPGEAVDTTKTIVEVVDMDHLTVDLDVPAAQLPSLAEGLAALVTPDQSNTEYHGKVFYVSPEVDARTGTIQVGIDLSPDPALRPGMTVRVRIIAEEHADRLAVPRSSVVTDDDGNTVIAVIAGDQATLKKVQVGFTEGDLTEVEADGLKEGDAVVTAGAYGLADGTKVTVAEPGAPAGN